MSSTKLAVDLHPYVPRLAATWDACHPGRRWAEEAGSLVSADISGFTKLSERLAGLGREGAEELTALLNGRFTAMIEVVDRHGGDVLKFGGDALLVLFTGEGHAARATLASLGMRATVDDPLNSALAGRVRLRMSVGIHTGSFACFLVQGGHRELLISGEAATATVTCEAEAKAGEILVSHATAGALPGRWLGAHRPEGRLVRRLSGDPDAPDPARARDPDVDLTSLVPSAQQAMIASGATGEHRQVTTAFLKFSETDELLRSEGPAALAERLQHLAEMVAAAAERHDVHWLGSDVYPDGGKLILTAGAPTTVGDDEERLLRTVRAVLDTTAGLRLHAGMHRGPVFAGLVGSPARRTFTVMGDAVNLAARLMQKAGAGELIASDEVLHRSATTFGVAPLEPFFVKGKSKPIHASVVGDVLRDGDAGPDHDLPFVGREVELELIERAAERARRGEGAVIDVVGEPGVGKSRLLDEALTQTQDLPTVSVRCSPYGRTTPYFAMRPIVRQIAGIHAEADVEEAGRLLEAWVEAVAPEQVVWAPLIALLVDAEVAMTPEVEQIGSAFRRAALHRATGAVLVGALQDYPVRVVIEDAHLIDDASEALLRELLPLFGGAPVLVCFARRPGPGADWGTAGGGEVIRLGTLPAAATAELAAEVGAQVHPEVLRTLIERSGGNPLFLRELLAVVASGSADDLPESLERLITARIDTLVPDDRMLLRDAAVLGLTVDLEVLAAVRPEAVDPDRWRSLAGFITPSGPGQARFGQALYQQVAYEGLSYRRRRHVHHVVGDALEQRHGGDGAEVAALLSLHFSLGRTHDRAWRYGRLAGDQARRKNALVEAAALYGRALESVGPASVPTDEVREVSEALGDVCEVAARYDEAVVAYGEARRLAVNAVDRVRLLRKEGILRERVGKYTQALRWYGRGLSVADNEDGAADRERIELSLAYAGVRYRQGRYRDCVRCALDAVEAIERRSGSKPDTEDLAALAHAYYLLDLGYSYLGAAASAEYRGRALPLYEQLDDLLGQANVLNNLGIAAYHEGRWDEALGLYERARAASERVGDVVGMAMGVNNIGEILSDQGHLERAADLLRRALETWQRAGYPVGVAEATSNLGRAEARAGRTDEGLGLLATSLAWFREVDATGFVLRDAVRHAEALLLADRWAEGRQELQELTERFRRAEGDPVDHAALTRLVALGHLHSGEIDAARRAIDDAVDRAITCGAAYEHGNALLVRAAVCSAVGEPSAVDAATGRAMLDGLGVVRTWLVPDIGRG